MIISDLQSSPVFSIKNIGVNVHKNRFKALSLSLTTGEKGEKVKSLHLEYTINQNITGNFQFHPLLSEIYSQKSENFISLKYKKAAHRRSRG